MEASELVQNIFQLAIPFQPFNSNRNKYWHKLILEASKVYPLSTNTDSLRGSSDSLVYIFGLNIVSDFKYRHPLRLQKYTGIPQVYLLFIGQGFRCNLTSSPSFSSSTSFGNDII